MAESGIDYSKLLGEYRREVKAMQAEIDALMLEFCPERMTPAQIKEWARHQKPSPIKVDF